MLINALHGESTNSSVKVRTSIIYVYLGNAWAGLGTSILYVRISRGNGIHNI